VIDVRSYTVGPVQENCYIVRDPGSGAALIVDPGEEADRLLKALEDLDVKTVDAILLTHTHFDHVGAVAPVVRATGAPVYCPELEKQVLANIMDYVPWPGFGPFESYDADHTVKGGETLTLAGQTIEVIFTPGHSPGHVSYSVKDTQGGAPHSAREHASPPAPGRALNPALFSGDVLFQGSVGRTDLPGGDGPALLASIQELLDTHPGETTVYPGHMGITTLARERATNPFLQELAQR
jgi:glyoxylase-like metal-dependent hydrolase (beta-lactamase superfamily II)